MESGELPVSAVTVVKVALQFELKISGEVHRFVLVTDPSIREDIAVAP